MILMANWKMHGGVRFAKRYFSLMENLVGKEALKKRFVFFPQPPLAGVFAGQDLLWGAADFHFAAKGAFTGAASLEVFKEMGARFALAGHSERRGLFKESLKTVEQKFLFALKEGFFPVLCVGEGKGRKRGAALKRQLEFLKPGLKAALKTGLKTRRESLSLPRAFQAAPFAIAYEPLWAIGSGRALSQEELAKATGFIRDFLSPLKPLVLYGGSVSASNAKALCAAGPDGFLVGGASLDPKSLSCIFKQTQSAARGL